MVPEYDFRPAWGLNDPQIMHDAKEFWRELKLLGPAEIERRASELIMVAYYEGKVVGVTTATLNFVDQLRMSWFKHALLPEN